MAKNSPFVEWETLEHPMYEHGSDWFISVGIVAFACAVASTILGNYIFAVLIMVGAGALLLHAARVPKRIIVRIFDKGLITDNILYPMNSLRAFFVDEHNGKLLIRTTKLFLPTLVLDIENTPADSIRKILSSYIKEEEIEESFWEKLMEYFGFY